MGATLPVEKQKNNRSGVEVQIEIERRDSLCLWPVSTGFRNLLMMENQPGSAGLVGNVTIDKIIYNNTHLHKGGYLWKSADR